MANTGFVDLEKELTCSICTDLLYQPLTLLDCLHTFCGYCLKEWFSWQGSNHGDRRRYPQFTCPSCRASVRDTRHDAKVTTLLDLFLRSHPEKEKPTEEKNQIAEKYKPGDGVLPVGVSSSQPPSDGDDEEDRRLLEEVREMSLRDSQGRGRHMETQIRVPTSLVQRGAVAEQTPEHQRIEDARRRRRATRQMNATSRSRSPLDGSSQRARQVEHQSSLRSLLSNPDFTETAIQEEILRQIAEEGLLDGIDLQSLDPDQEEELTERIAEAFRRRQRRRVRSGGRSNEAHSIQASSGSRSHSVSQPNTERSRQSEAVQGQYLRSSGHATASGHRRSASDRGIGRRRTSPVPTSSEERIYPARRSATDVSNPTRVRRESHSRIAVDDEANSRSTTADQTPSHTRQRPASSRSDRREILVRQRAEPTSLAESPVSTTHSQSSRILDSRAGLGHKHRSNSRSSTNNQSDRLAVPSSRPPPSRQAGIARSVPSSFVEPSISCERCGKKNLEYELHKLCTRCNNGTYHLCLRCYRLDLGCLHWFGFGDSAHSRFKKSQDSLPPEQRSEEAPHKFRSRRFLAPAKESVLPTTGEGGTHITNSDPLGRLQDGLFCDMCQFFSDDCYWKCGECNDGEWGFCNSCVNKGKCCTHALLPIARVDERTGQMRSFGADGSPTNAASSPVPGSSITVDTREYRILTFSTRCNICTYPIPPSVTRYHCPTCNDGDYDICRNCYVKLCAMGKISRDNGRNGWRRCLQNHRMVIVGFEDHENGQRRVIVSGLVGGYAMKDDLDPTTPNSLNRPDSGSPNSPLSRQDSDPWEWPEGSNSNNPDAADLAKGTRRKLNRSRHHLSGSSGDSPKSPLAPRFPPSGGIGLRLVAIWSYYPDPEETDEIMFPRGAEITEAENINDDWFWGCYAGQKGLFPGYYANVVEAVDILN
ncbi:C3HC4 type (RING finger) zinc finger containing protein [Coccidioides posadasii C735 delta SOWgp]|uniref:C3HC4 type (RING finger) zinc finger containing protein n=1 Tax=Coccidioides posadasii (strain C735) TaxID=222929 RepID=C5PBW8_COCP7|nr:C3HC4 type (RING finger) zinc finger containing protein [Coccidioides posadasii C735 delta SOWgp]EER25445.1 C3HC4 type (RING finger) zinc finger containing protein [Coccidioides posadasii C735 delta SOWgp]|eukprot:XP_003067590.1 C3HC4 type (RING finger) zinc finger containing protein [Coccidioides posadasii C735 delta SOWgp]